MSTCARPVEEADLADLLALELVDATRELDERLKSYVVERVVTGEGLPWLRPKSPKAKTAGLPDVDAIAIAIGVDPGVLTRRKVGPDSEGQTTVRRFLVRAGERIGYAFRGNAAMGRSASRSMGTPPPKEVAETHWATTAELRKRPVYGLDAAEDSRLKSYLEGQRIASRPLPAEERVYKSGRNKDPANAADVHKRVVDYDAIAAATSIVAGKLQKTEVGRRRETHIAPTRLINIYRDGLGLDLAQARETSAEVLTQRAAIAAADAPTFADLLELASGPVIPDDKTSYNRFHKYKSQLEKWLSYFHVKITDTVNQELIDSLENSVSRIIEAFELSPASAKSFRMVMRTLARAHAENIGTWSSNEVEFSRTIRAKMAARDLTLKRLIERVRATIGPQADDRKIGERLRSWIADGRSPMPNSNTNEVILSALEDVLDEPRGGLARLVRRRSPRMMSRGVHWKQKEYLPTISSWISWYSIFLPADFDKRAEEDQIEVMEWINANILQQATEYGAWRRRQVGSWVLRPDRQAVGEELPPELCAGDQLVEEVGELIDFKTRPMPPPGMERKDAWTTGGLSGSRPWLRMIATWLASSVIPNPFQTDPFGDGHPALGLGPKASLAFIVVPDATLPLLDVLATRRVEPDAQPFYTGAELNICVFMQSLLGESGWLRQRPDLVERLEPVPRHLSASTITDIRADWEKACDKAYDAYLKRRRRIQGLAKGRTPVRTGKHRDPFMPILPVLNDPAPLVRYRQILDEMLRYRPSTTDTPIRHAHFLRERLLFDIATQTHLRQRQLRELMFTAKGERPTPDGELINRRMIELRYGVNPEVFESEQPGWYIRASTKSFKNAGSHVYGDWQWVDFPLVDQHDLYADLEAYLQHSRRVLIGEDAETDRTLFVNWNRGRDETPADRRKTGYGFTEGGLRKVWSDIIRRFGIYNPYTGRGVIPGLMPHGPNAVRDVVATHIIKETGTKEDAASAILDDPATLDRHYVRFGPQDRRRRAQSSLKKALSGKSE